jgi:uncharacterized membrane protein YcaP (DUF421 family)
MEEVQPWDWKRIMLGEVPPEFMLEVLARTIIVFLILLIVVRLLGKRMNGQISVVELAVMVTLGAIVSPGMQLPDRAILFVFIALGVIYLLHTLVNKYGARNEKFEKLIEGEMTCLVKDGIMQLDAMKKTRISRQELFAQLRRKSVENLATVERAYLEACGIFTIYTTEEKKAGLLVFPEKDDSIFDYKLLVNHGKKACCNCGHVQNIETESKNCKVCKHQEWMNAYA